jgi:hypothetical protein
MERDRVPTQDSTSPQPERGSDENDRDLSWVFVLSTRSQQPGTLEMNEVSLAIRTPKGLAVVVGCSHPGRGEDCGGSCENRFAALHGDWGLPPCPHPPRRAPALGNRSSRFAQSRTAGPWALHKRIWIRGFSGSVQGPFRTGRGSVRWFRCSSAKRCRRPDCAKTGSSQRTSTAHTGTVQLLGAKRHVVLDIHNGGA